MKPAFSRSQMNERNIALHNLQPAYLRAFAAIDQEGFVHMR